MTTMELIERGIGHNCLSDAYELGRADAIVEVIKLYEEFQPKLATNVYELGERLRQMQKGEENG